MEKVLEFKNFNQWVEKASSWLSSYDMKNIICKDQKGRVCKKGSDFMKAKDENAFPVEVYLVDKQKEIEELEDEVFKIKVIISKFLEEIKIIKKLVDK